MSCYLLPEQVSGSTFLWGASSLSLNLVLLNLRYWCKTPDFLQNFPDQDFTTVWALLFRSKFHSWKFLCDWVLKRTFLTTHPGIGHQSNFLAWPFSWAPLCFPLMWYFWIPVIVAKPLTFVKICLIKAPPRFGPCSFGANSIPANSCGIEFWKELSNTTRPGISFTRAPLRFPFIWYFWILVINRKPLNFVKFRPTKAPQRFGASSIPKNASGIEYWKELF